MVKFSRFPVYLVSVGLLAAGAVAGSAATASAGTLASCTAKGNDVSCATAAQAKHPLTLSVTVTTSPAQSVIVAWNDDCSLGSTSKKESGTFVATTPLTRTIPHAFKQPDSCIFAAASGITGNGSVKVSLSASSTASHEVKGYAGLCADDAGNRTTLGNKIQTWACHNYASEQWSFSHGELVHRGLCMNDKANGGNGSKIVLYKCSAAANEVWTHNSHGEYVLKAHRGTLCLTDPGFSKKNGTQLTVATCRNTANQHWTLP